MARGTLIPRLLPIVDVDAAERAGWTPADLARAYLDGGARLLQLRAKRLPAGRFLDLCDNIVNAARVYRAAIVINDRVDLAQLCGAAGVHVGQDDLAPRTARHQLGPNAMIGFSTHTVVQIEAAAGEPITYLAVGPVFTTGTKDSGYTAVGLERIIEARRMTPPALPIVAIGGITLDRARDVLAAGAQCVAVISDLLAGGDPSARVRAYHDRLAEAGGV